MTKTKRTGETCVGDLRLTPLDVGFDLRNLGIEIRLPEQFASVGFEEAGETYLVEGTREEMVTELQRAGYRVATQEQS